MTMSYDEFINDFENTDSKCKKTIENSSRYLYEDFARTVTRFSDCKANSTRKLTWVHVVSTELQQFLKTRTSLASDDRLDYWNVRSNLGTHRLGCRATRH